MSEYLTDGDIIQVRDDPLNYGPELVRRICEELLERRLTAPRPTEGDVAKADRAQAAFVAKNIVRLYIDNDTYAKATGNKPNVEEIGEQMIGFITAALSATRADERGPFQTKIAELQKEIRSLEARVRELEDGIREILYTTSTPEMFNGGAFQDACAKGRALLGEGEDGND